jgi:hypothetical protein
VAIFKTLRDVGIVTRNAPTVFTAEDPTKSYSQVDEAQAELEGFGRHIKHDLSYESIQYVEIHNLMLTCRQLCRLTASESTSVSVAEPVCPDLTKPQIG